MTLRDWLLGTDEPAYETTEHTEEITLRETFTRKTVFLKFVRGGTDTITYDVFDGDRDEYDGYPREFSDGKWITSRGDVRVERFMEYSGRAIVGRKKPHGGEWEDYVDLRGVPTGSEVTTSNVASRRTLKETEMEVTVECERMYKTRDDTGERVYEGYPTRLGENPTPAEEVDDG